MNSNWLLTQAEGQFLERKSCYEQRIAPARPRPFKELLRAVAETLAAMANADGGTVVVGVEDDGAVSGIPPQYELEKARVQINDYIRPKLSFQAREITLNGQRVWIFETEWSAEVHQLTDGRYLLRVGSQSLPFPAKDIDAIKSARRQRTTETQIFPEATLDDLDLSLVHELAPDSRSASEPEKLLVRYRLAEDVNGQLRLCLAALLLFGKAPAKWHPHCGVQFVRWAGNERRSGVNLNIVKRLRFENLPLVRLLKEVHCELAKQLPARQPLVDLFFEEKLTYPEFVWQEAIVNAVAHRDYSLTGLGIEVHLYDDRMEIWSPGELVPPVTLQRLLQRERVHASRNPRIVRVLTELGFMRELGEGIPRMFDVMEREWLRPPEFRLEAGQFVVTLRSTPLYRPETVAWLGRFRSQRLSKNQLRLLAFAHERGDRFTSREYQRLAGVDIYTAARDIRELVRRGIAKLTKPKGRIYEVLAEPSEATREKPAQLMALEPILRTKGYVKNEDIRRALGVTLTQANWIAKQLVNQGWLEPQGEKRGRRYLPARPII